MKLILTSDLHFEPFKSSKILFEVGIDFLNYLAFHHKDAELNILGDLIDSGLKINTFNYLKLFETFEKIKTSFAGINILFGNHDIINTNNDSIIKSFNCFTIQKYWKREVNEKLTIHYLAYSSNPDDINNIIVDNGKMNLLFTHLDINDFRVTKSYKVENGLSRGLFDKFDLVFSGHYHLNQEEGKFIYLGTPYQTSFDEEANDCFYYIFDTDTLKYEKVLYENYPKFKTLKLEDVKEAEGIDNSFIRLIVDKKIDNLASISYFLHEKGAIDIKHKFEIKREDSEDLIKLDETQNLEKIIFDYFEQRASKEKLELDKLVSLYTKLKEKI